MKLVIKMRSRWSTIAVFICGLLCLVLAGCEQSAPGGAGTNEPPNESQADNSATEDPGTTNQHADAPDVAMKPEDVKLEIVDYAGYEKTLARHQGSVVLVDYWATWCLPCVKNFPHIVELGKEHAGEGLAVVSLSVDDPESQADVRQFLAGAGADFENLLSKFGTSTKTGDEFRFGGDVPFYRLYDRQGKLRYQFSNFFEDLENGQPVENIDQRVKELLAEKMPPAS